MTTAILAILVSAPFSTFVDCGSIVGYDEKKNEWSLELVPEETDNMVNSLYKLRERV